MKCNVGKVEKMWRIGVGVVAIVLGMYIHPLFYIITAIGFLTALLGYCPVSHVLGINTCEKDSKSPDQEGEESEEPNNEPTADAAEQEGETKGFGQEETSEENKY